MRAAGKWLTPTALISTIIFAAGNVCHRLTIVVISVTLAN